MEPYDELNNNQKLKVKAQEIIELILKDDNFGVNDLSRHTNRHTSYWKGKIFSIRKQMKRWRSLFIIIPLSMTKYILIDKPKLIIKVLNKANH